MSKTIVLVAFLLTFFGCESTKPTNLPEIKASRGEAVVVATVDLEVKDIPKGSDCGSSSCMAYLTITEVKEFGQGFSKELANEQRILAYFSFGTTGADSTTHKGLVYQLPSLETGNKISATLLPIGEIDGAELYKVDLYTKLN